MDSYRRSLAPTEIKDGNVETTSEMTTGLVDEPFENVDQA